VVNPNYSFLGATPDEKVCIDSVTGILEIKCPYAVRDMKIEEAIQTNNFCLVREGDVVTINKSHDYYCQVQGQLFVTGAPFCDFIVYAKVDIAVDKVLPDPDFQLIMFDKLCKLYKNFAIPFIQNLPASSV